MDLTIPGGSIIIMIITIVIILIIVPPLTMRILTLHLYFLYFCCFLFSGGRSAMCTAQYAADAAANTPRETPAFVRTHTPRRVLT